MKNKKVLEILNEYLKDDGKERDIIRDLVNKLGITVFNAYTDINGIDKDFFAVTIIDSQTRMIILNKTKLNDMDNLKFVLAYQIAEVIKYNKEELFSVFKLDFIDFDIYKDAKVIYNRSNIDKNKKSIIKKKK